MKFFCTLAALVAAVNVVEGRPASSIATPAAVAAGNYTLVWKNETGTCTKAGLMPVNYKDPKQTKTNSTLTLEGCEQVCPPA